MPIRTDLAIFKQVIFQCKDLFTIKQVTELSLIKFNTIHEIIPPRKTKFAEISARNIIIWKVEKKWFLKDYWKFRKTKNLSLNKTKKKVKASAVDKEINKQILHWVCFRFLLGAS